MIRFERVTNLEEGKKWWDIFSPHKTICDCWEYRFTFYKYFHYDVLFIVGFVDGVAIGLLPLQYNTQNQYFEFFGGSYMEDNTVFVTSGFEIYRKDFYGAIDGPAHLEYISDTDDFTSTFEHIDYKYFLPLDGIQDFESYLSKYLESESRGKMRRKIKKMEEQGIMIQKNNLQDIHVLFELNKQAFLESSTFFIPFREKSFEDILQLNIPHTLMTFSLNGEIKAVSLAVMYNGVYEYLNLGADRTIRELRTFIHVKNIEEAIASRASLLNAFSADCGWKELFHFCKIPQYKFDKTA